MRIAEEVVPGLARHKKRKTSRASFEEVGLSKVEKMQTDNLENKEGKLNEKT